MVLDILAIQASLHMLFETLGVRRYILVVIKCRQNDRETLKTLIISFLSSIVRYRGASLAAYCGPQQGIIDSRFTINQRSRLLERCVNVNVHLLWRSQAPSLLAPLVSICPSNLSLLAWFESTPPSEHLSVLSYPQCCHWGLR